MRLLLITRTGLKKAGRSGEIDFFRKFTKLRLNEHLSEIYITRTCRRLI